MSRYRTKPGVYHTGWHWYSRFPTTTYTDTEYSGADECWDTLHPYPFVAEGDFLSINRSKVVKPARITYECWQNSRKYSGIQVPVVPSGLGPELTIDFATLLQDALSRIQQTSPVVNIPQLVLELKDFPHTLKSLAGKASAASKVGSGYLAWQWAIAPLVQDILSMLSLQRQIADRMQRHRKKYRTERARGKLPNRWVVTPGQPSSTRPFAYGHTTTLYASAFSKGRCWYTARLEPQIELSDLLAQQADVSFQKGLSGDPRQALVTLYELTPWSWLIDYFSNLGDLLNASANLVPYSVKSVCLMVDVTWGSKTSLPNSGFGTTTKWIKSDGVEGQREKHRKVYANPMTELVLTPLLSLRQATNLAALATSVLSK